MESKYYKHIKAEESWKAANFMIEGKYYRQAAVLFWVSIRDYIFEWLELKSIAFSSTREAIVAILSNEDFSVHGKDIMFIYSIATMAEWDEYFNLSIKELNELKKICKVLKEKFIEFVDPK